MLGLFFSTLDTSIVSISLVTISHDLDDFLNAQWVMLAYMLTYMGKPTLCHELHRPKPDL